MTELYNKVFSFLTTAKPNHITAFSVIYQVMENNFLIKKNELSKIIEKAVNNALQIIQDMNIRDKLYNISTQVC